MNTENKVLPIFLFSLPRSGSTLVQRVLASHHEISTASEPWFLLPFLMALKEKGTYSEYGHRVAAKAINDFCAILPNGKQNYLNEVASLARRLYQAASSRESIYFLDKTPRYHLIVDNLMDMFPEAKRILLWRNPLAVVASVIETFDAGRWNLYKYKVDMFKGLEGLIAAYENKPEAYYTINYESVVSHADIELPALFNSLDLSYDASVLTSFNTVTLMGTAGDPTGVKLYSKISKEPLDKWKIILANPIRKAWCRQYLNWIGKERLKTMGYEFDLLINELDSLPNSLAELLPDLAYLGYGVTYNAFEPLIAKDKIHLKQWRYLCSHF